MQSEYDYRAGKSATEAVRRTVGVVNEFDHFDGKRTTSRSQTHITFGAGSHIRIIHLIYFTNDGAKIVDGLVKHCLHIAAILIDILERHRS